MEQVDPESFGSLKDLVGRTLAASGELEGWLVSAGYGDVLATVRATKSSERYTEAVLRAIDRRGLIDDSFFTKLAERLPQHAAEVARIARDLGCELSEVSAPLPLGEPPDQGYGTGYASTARGDGGDEYPLPRMRGSRGTSGGDGPESATRPPPPDEGMRLPELAAVLRAARSVVELVDDQQLPVATGGLLPGNLLLAPDYVCDMVGAGARPVAYARLEQVDGPPRFSRVLDVVAADRRLGLGVCRLDVTLGEGIGLVDLQPAVGSHLSLLHFPMGGSMRISRAQVVGATHSLVPGPTVAYVAPTAPGSGGGLLVDSAGRLVAVNHSRVSTGQDFGILTAALIELLRGRPEFNDVVSALLEPSTIVAVDPGLDARFRMAGEAGGTEALPVLVRVQSSSVDLSSVDGVDVSSTLGRTVAATVTEKGLAAIRRRPDILAIDLSRNIGTQDLFRSIPAIGWAPPQAGTERGEESLVAVIDEGIDVHHECFIVDHSSSKVEAYWDQTSGDTPCMAASPATRQWVDELNLQYGRLYLRADIDAILAGQLPDTLPSPQETQHGTAVASIAAGVACGEGIGAFPGGVAPGARLIVVRFHRDQSPRGYETSHIDALAFIDAVASRLGRPVVVNISSGVNAGAHDGADPIEKACEDFSGAPGRIIVKSAGNERTKGRHARLDVPAGAAGSFDIDIADEDGTDLVEFWWPAKSDYAVEIIPPSGPGSGEISRDFRDVYLPVGGGQVIGLLIPRIDRDGRARAQLKLEFAPLPGRRVPAGTWRIRFTGRVVPRRPNGEIHGWLEIGARQTHFVDANVGYTITIPGTCDTVVCVGAIAPRTPIEMYDESSEGPTLAGDKPDLVAPGVDIQAAAAGSVTLVGPVASGTSFAAPHVTGAVALGLSASFKRNPTAMPMATEVLGALRDHTDQVFEVWNERLGYGPLNVASFLAMLEDTLSNGG